MTIRLYATPSKSYLLVALKLLFKIFIIYLLNRIVCSAFTSKCVPCTKCYLLISILSADDYYVLIVFRIFHSIEAYKIIIENDNSCHSVQTNRIPRT